MISMMIFRFDLKRRNHEKHETKEMKYSGLTLVISFRVFLRNLFIDPSHSRYGRIVRFVCWSFLASL